MEAKDLKAIIEQVLQEMNVSSDEKTTAAVAAATEAAAPKAAASEGISLKIPKKGVELEPSVIEDGCLQDITEIDIRKQYLVENPVNGEAYAEQKVLAPCRLGIGKAGARYKTLPQLEFRAAHSAAQDAVFNDVDEEFVKDQGLFIVQTQCDSKDTYLTRPDLGRKLSPEAVETIKEKCKKNPTVQIYVADGLSSAAVAANIGDLLPAILQGLDSYKIDYGTTVLRKIRPCRQSMDEISRTYRCRGCTCTLIGERPGLITADVHVRLHRLQGHRGYAGGKTYRGVQYPQGRNHSRRGRRSHRRDHQDHAGDARPAVPI